MNSLRALFAILATCHVLHGQNPVRDSTAMAALDDQRVIQAGDWLSINVGSVIQVGKDHSLTWINRVDSAGGIPVPCLKEHYFNPVGLTAKAFAYTINRELEKNYFTHFLVIVKHTGKPKAGTMEALDNRKPLNPGDVVSIRIKEDKRKALVSTISQAGEIQCPYIGPMKAIGLTCQDLAFQCKAELEKNFFKTATVLVAKTEIAADSVTIRCPGPDYLIAHGRVLKPAKYNYPYNREITVSEFLKMVGGHVSKREVPRIQIIRYTPNGNKRILVNSRAILIEKRKEYDLFLRWEDVMIVE